MFKPYLWELVIRCRVCGRKYPFQVSPEIFREYQDHVFFPIPCPKCKPQTSLEDYIIRYADLTDYGLHT